MLKSRTLFRKKIGVLGRRVGEDAMEVALGQWMGENGFETFVGHGSWWGTLM